MFSVGLAKKRGEVVGWGMRSFVFRKGKVKNRL